MLWNHAFSHMKVMSTALKVYILDFDALQKINGLSSMMSGMGVIVQEFFLAKEMKEIILTTIF